MTFGEEVLQFYKGLKIEFRLPDGIEVLNPYQDDTAFNLCQSFYGKFYNDHLERFIILGINPGRFGGGITGIPFTDPIKLESLYDIKSQLPKKAELSADFIHKIIGAFGGPEYFYSKFYINSISPLGFTKSGKNLNYYDGPELMKSLEPFIQRSIQSQLKFGIRRDVAFCLGEGSNFKFLQRLNERKGYFQNIIPLAHPRFIMQYKRKQLARYVGDYLEKLNSVF